MDSTLKQVLIADDEPLARERLHRLVDKLPGYQVCAEAGDGDDTLAQASRLKPDILLLDIQMPGMDGLSAARRLSALTNPPAVVFCTAYDQYALQAFEVNAIAYLLKPVRSEALADALARAQKLNRLQVQQLAEGRPEAGGQLAVSGHRGTELIEVADLRYCQADQKYVTLHHAHGETLCGYTLKELEQNYPDQLLRIHRNTLVGRRFIQGLHRRRNGQTVLTLKDSETALAVSRRHAGEVRQWLQTHQQPP